MGITLVDSLDTLHLLGLKEELSHARHRVETIQYERDYDASFFETTIRHLGGLLSIYHLTKDEMYLRKVFLFRKSSVLDTYIYGISLIWNFSVVKTQIRRVS